MLGTYPFLCSCACLIRRTFSGTTARGALKQKLGLGDHFGVFFYCHPLVSDLNLRILLWYVYTVYPIGSMYAIYIYLYTFTVKINH